MSNVLQIPSMEFKFFQKYEIFMQKSNTARIIFLVVDEKFKTGTGTDFKIYKNKSEAMKDKSFFEEKNYSNLMDLYAYDDQIMVYAFAIAKQVDISKGIVKENDLIETLSRVEDKCRPAWIVFPQADTAGLISTLCGFVREQMKKPKHFRLLVYRLNEMLGTTSGDNGDNPHIVNFFNETVTRDGKDVSGKEYLCVLASVLAGSNVVRGVTNQVVPFLTWVKESTNPQGDIDQGRFLLYNDEEKVRILLERNTFTNTMIKNDSWQVDTIGLISTIEATDLMTDDITKVFMEEYSAKGKKNTLSNQMQFISATNDYFKLLASGDAPVLDPTYNNRVIIDVASQRNAWVEAGVTEAKNWDDEKVMSMPFKRTLFLFGDIKIAQSIDSFKFSIKLF